jgi:hypothetical protein
MDSFPGRTTVERLNKHTANSGEAVFFILHVHYLDRQGPDNYSFFNPKADTTN